MENGYVKSSFDGKILRVEFYHPKGNSLPANLLHELSARIREGCENEQVRVVLLQSAGNKAFCAGASFDELLSVQNFDDGVRFFSGFAEVILAMKNCPKFVVSKVQGKAVGGGVGLIAASDYVLASDEALVKLSEISIGIGPFVIAAAVERKIGKAAFSEMSIDAQWKSADWALRKGLFNRVAGKDELEKETDEFTKKLIEYSPSAVRELKKLLWSDTDNWETLLFERAKLSAELVLGKEARDFLKNFASK